MNPFFLQNRVKRDRPMRPEQADATAILETLLPHAYRYALRLTRDEHAAEDLTQEALMRAWRHDNQHTDERTARLWVLRVVANLWRDEHRRRDVAHRHQARMCSQREAVSTGSRAEAHESIQDAMALLDRLPERQRDVLYLTACEELTPGEIAQVLDTTPRAVISSLSVAREKVRTMTAIRHSTLDTAS